MTNLETLGFTKETGLNGLSLNNVAVSLHWSGEEAVVAVDGKQVFNSENEEEIIAFVKSEISKNKATQESDIDVAKSLAVEVANNEQVVKYYNDENDFGKTELIKNALSAELPKSVKMSEFKKMVEDQMQQEEAQSEEEVKYSDYEMLDIRKELVLELRNKANRLEKSFQQHEYTEDEIKQSIDDLITQFMRDKWGVDFESNSQAAAFYENTATEFRIDLQYEMIDLYNNQ